MSLTIILSVVLLVLGVIGLALSFLEAFEDYRSPLLIVVLLLIAASIGMFSINYFYDLSPDSPLVHSPLETPVPVAEAPAEPTIQEVSAAEIGFEGCLLYVSNRTDDFEIYKMENSPDNIIQLTNSPNLDITPSWSADGQKIAFASLREEGAGFQIYVMNSDGSEQNRVGEQQPGDNSDPSWSPDGKQIVYQSKRDTNNNPADDEFDIYLMNADGSDIHSLSLNAVDDTKPRWSPDGNYIAYLSEKTGQDELYIMEPDGTGGRQLTDEDILKGSLRWSPNSDAIIFEGNQSMYRVDRKSKELVELVAFDKSSKNTPAWGKNENFIFFASDRSGDWDLYLLDQSNPQQIRFAQLTNDPAVDHTPVWFPCSQ
jgi:TolB protein